MAISTHTQAGVTTGGNSTTGGGISITGGGISITGGGGGSGGGGAVVKTLATQALIGTPAGPIALTRQ
jgi:hypothetical protein